MRAIPACFAALARAVETYRRPAEWQALQQRGMKEDLSWAASAQRYVELYRKAQEFKATG